MISKILKLTVILGILVFTPFGEAQTSLTPGGRFSLHGMVLYGAGPYFLDHIPMLMAPHDYQVIAEVTLSDASGRPLSKDFSNGTFTLRPNSKFSLNDYVDGRLKTFTGAVFDGGFEQGGQIIRGLENVRVEVKEVKLARQLPGSSRQEVVEVSDGANIYQANVIVPERNVQMIKRKNGPTLWCVVGPDFSEPCP
jgi:hypothetical protein